MAPHCANLQKNKQKNQPNKVKANQTEKTTKKPLLFSVVKEDEWK